MRVSAFPVLGMLRIKEEKDAKWVITLIEISQLVSSADVID